MKEIVSFCFTHRIPLPFVNRCARYRCVYTYFALWFQSNSSAVVVEKRSENLMRE